MTPVGAPGRPTWWRLLLLAGGTLLVLYGGVGLLFDLHLPERLVQGGTLLIDFFRTGHFPTLDSPYPWDLPPWLASLRTHFDAAVLGVWLSWGMGVALLLMAAGRPLGYVSWPRRGFSWRDAAALVLLAGVLWLGYGLRERFLLPLDNGAVPVSHYDEMVYLEAALLGRNGLLPYTDFFLAHPPGIVLALWPAALAGEEWGGTAVLVAGRYWQCVWGLAAVALLYWVGREIGGRWAGLLAALVLALDVQAVQVAPLETVVNLATVGALALYIAGLKVGRGWGRYLLLGLAGAAAASAAMTKVPGAVALLLLALPALLAGRWRDLLAAVAGAAATALGVAGPWALRAPGAFFRQVVAFQLLRPQETLYGRNHLARMADYPESRLTFLLLVGAVVVATVVALWQGWSNWRGRRGRRAEAEPLAWVLPITVVVALLLALFAYGKAYHSRYYIQLVVPFALLVAAGLGALWPLVHRWPRWAVAVGVVVLAFLMLAWPHLVQQCLAGEMVRYDGTYGPVGRALQEATPAGAAVLALDPGYPLMAGRPPARLPDGTRLVDGAGRMVYEALGIAGMGFSRVLEEAGRSSRKIDPQAVFHRPAAQDLAVSALYGSAAAVIDPRVAAEDLTPQTQEFLATRGEEIIRTQYTAAFRVQRVSPLGRSASGLWLWDLNVRRLSAEGEEPAARPGEVLVVPVGEVLQVSLYWLVQQTPSHPLRVGLELLDGQGRPVTRLWEMPHFGDPPTERWLAGWVYQDHHNVPLGADIRPGRYALVVCLQDAVTGDLWTWEGATGGDCLPIGEAELVR